MRIMEQMVKRLGRRKNFSIRDLHKKPWGVILGEIKKKIDKLPDVTAADRGTRNRYYKCYLLLDAVCKAVRNPIMHAGIRDTKMTYTDEEAQDVMDRVKSFVRDFSTLR